MAAEDKSSERQRSLMSFMDEFRQNGMFIDVVLICEGERFPAHKNILAASSNYFLTMFNGHFADTNQQEIELCDISAKCLKVIIDFVYTSTINVTGDFINELLAVASYLQFENVVKWCINYLIKQLTVDNCMSIKYLAEKQNSEELQKAAKYFIQANFEEVITQKDSLYLSPSEMEEFLAADKYNIFSTDTVLKGVVNWSHARPGQRMDALDNLISYINPVGITKKTANSLSANSFGDRTRDWFDIVMNRHGQHEWNIFVLDKMGTNGDFCSFNLSFNGMCPLEKFPKPAFAVTMTGYKNVIFVQGGKRNTPTTESFFYDAYKQAWFDLPPLLMKRAHHCSAVLNNRLYAFGGNFGNGVTNSMECLDLPSEKSYFVENMHQKRVAFATAVHDGCIYAMGGENVQRSLCSVERYDPRTNHWDVLPNMTYVDGYCSSAVVNNEIYCVQGLCSYLAKFDIRTNSWQSSQLCGDMELYEIFSIENQLFSIASDGIWRYDFTKRDWQTMFKYIHSHDWDTVTLLNLSSYSF